MKKPTEAIEWLRGPACASLASSRYAQELIAYLDSIPEWPADLPRERLEELASEDYSSWYRGSDALRRLAAIAPQRGKRKVTIWCRSDLDEYIAKPSDWAPYEHAIWRKVGEVEIDA